MGGIHTSRASLPGRLIHNLNDDLPSSEEEFGEGTECLLHWHDNVEEEEEEENEAASNLLSTQRHGREKKSASRTRRRRSYTSDGAIFTMKLKPKLPRSTRFQLRKNTPNDKCPTPPPRVVTRRKKRPWNKLSSLLSRHNQYYNDTPIINDNDAAEHSESLPAHEQTGPPPLLYQHAFAQNYKRVIRRCKSQDGRNEARYASLRGNTPLHVVCGWGAGSGGYAPASAHSSTPTTETKRSTMTTNTGNFMTGTNARSNTIDNNYSNNRGGGHDDRNERDADARAAAVVESSLLSSSAPTTTSSHFLFSRRLWFFKSNSGASSKTTHDTKENKEEEELMTEASALDAILALILTYPQAVVQANKSDGQYTPLHLLCWWGLPNPLDSYYALEVMVSASMMLSRYTIFDNGGGYVTYKPKGKFDFWFQRRKKRRGKSRKWGRQKKKKKNRKGRNQNGGNHTSTEGRTRNDTSRDSMPRTTTAETPPTSIIHRTDGYGRTPLHLALLSPVASHPTVVYESLIRHDSQPGQTVLRPDAVGRTPLFIFCTKYKNEIGMLLKEVLERKMREAEETERRRRQERIRWGGLEIRDYNTTTMTPMSDENYDGWSIEMSLGGEEYAFPVTFDDDNNVGDGSMRDGTLPREREQQQQLRRRDFSGPSTTFGQYNPFLAPMEDPAGPAFSLHGTRNRKISAYPYQAYNQDSGSGGISMPVVGSCRYLNSVWTKATLLLRVGYYQRLLPSSGQSPTGSTKSRSDPNDAGHENDVLHAVTALYILGHCISYKLWRLVLLVHTLGLGRKDAFDDLPLHVAASCFGKGSDAVQALPQLALQHGYDDGDNERYHGRRGGYDGDDDTEAHSDRQLRRLQRLQRLHLQKSRRVVHVVETYLDIYPRAASVSNGSGQLPLAIAVEAIKHGQRTGTQGVADLDCYCIAGRKQEEELGLRLIRTLIRVNPGALENVRGMTDGLYPHIIAKFGNAGGWGSIYNCTDDESDAYGDDDSSDDDDVEPPSRYTSTMRADMGLCDGDLNVVYRLLRGKPTLAMCNPESGRN